MTKKQCSKCGEWKDAAEDFYKGRSGRCKECLKAAARAHYYKKTAGKKRIVKVEDPDRKHCPGCKTIKDRSEFYWDKRRARLDSWCKRCRVVASQKYYEANRQQQLEYTWDYWLKTNYGITADDYDILLEQQGGVCALCEKPPKSTRLGVDHCHDTGRVRGILCRACNTALGVLGDTPEGLRRALDYLTSECPIPSR